MMTRKQLKDLTIKEIVNTKALGEIKCFKQFRSSRGRRAISNRRRRRRQAAPKRFRFRRRRAAATCCRGTAAASASSQHSMRTQSCSAWRSPAAGDSTSREPSCSWISDASHSVLWFHSIRVRLGPETRRAAPLPSLRNRRASCWTVSREFRATHRAWCSQRLPLQIQWWTRWKGRPRRSESSSSTHAVPRNSRGMRWQRSSIQRPSSRLGPSKMSRRWSSRSGDKSSEWPLLWWWWTIQSTEIQNELMRCEAFEVFVH